jgi:hypothetical protein
MERREDPPANLKDVLNNDNWRASITNMLPRKMGRRARQESRLENLHHDDVVASISLVIAQAFDQKILIEHRDATITLAAQLNVRRVLSSCMGRWNAITFQKNKRHISTIRSVGWARRSDILMATRRQVVHRNSHFLTEAETNES